MAPRAYWKGYLRLSLVTCPIEIFPALSASEKTHFHMINKRTGNRLHQQMVDDETGKVVDKEDKGRGYELGKNRYVEIDEDELAAIQIESTHTVDIDGFVPNAEIDKRYYDRPYYVVPSDRVGAEAFAVIRDAMKNKDSVALARIVMAHREHIIALEPLDNGILGTTLCYDYEVRSEKEYFADIPLPRISKEMIALAEHILETKATHFDPRQFKDRYEAALKALVKRKVAGKKIDIPEPEEQPSNVVNLMDALRQSLGAGKGRRRKARAATRHVGPQRRRSKAA
jgi:Ku protein